ncbi:PQQ-binding-like beta-propeller repeat protein [Kitasatospora sp. NPDC057223]|uniref:outer membrane protein assembly factor BamB family protein n=1 Tax=Kitasatospora sp. NPDC057223 TaxID=3346055 RepID=UPI00362E141D
MEVTTPAEQGVWAGGRSGGICIDLPDGDGPQPTDELARPPAGRPTRRQLLLGGGALAAAAAGWWLTREDRPRPPGTPVATSGPEPLWTFHGPAAQAPERLDGPQAVALFATRSELLSLDPVTGAQRRRIRRPPGGAGGGRELLGGDRVFGYATGLLTGRHLTDPAQDWQFAVPSTLVAPGTPLALDCYDGEALHGRAPAALDGPTGAPLLLALSARTRELLWSRAATENGGDLTELRTAPGQRLIARSSRDELVALSSVDGTRQWLAATDQALGWYESDAEHVYVAARASGLRALRLTDGAPSWGLAPGPDEAWRCLQPLAAGGALFVPRDNGLVTRNGAADGTESWARQLPFRIDLRSRPVLVGRTLFVPGPRAGGVWALDAATGEVRWVFQDSGPGVDFWRLSTDGEHLFAGHDDVLYSLPVD